MTSALPWTQDAMTCQCGFSNLTNQMQGDVYLFFERATERGHLRNLLAGYSFGVDYQRQRVRLYPSAEGFDGHPDYVQDFQNGTMYILEKGESKACWTTNLTDAWKVPQCLPAGLEPYFNWYRELHGVANITTYTPKLDPNRRLQNFIFYYMRPGNQCAPFRMVDGRQVNQTMARYYRLLVKDYALSGHADVWLFPNTTGCSPVDWPW